MSKILPTKKEFQSLANDIKIESNISRCQAYEKLAKQYGYRTYHDIKPLLNDTKQSLDLTSLPGVEIITHDEFYKMQKEQMFNEASKVNTYFKPYHQFKAQMLIEGIAYEPKLPNNFWNTPNEDRDFEELENWWDVAFIVNNGKGYFIVYILDGGAWDRPTRKGTFDKFEAALELAQNLNNLEVTNKNKYITLSTGAVVNFSGLFINAKGIRTVAEISSKNLDHNQINKAKIFIENIIEQRETINKTNGTSYSLKHRVEEFLYHYFKGEDNYISNGEMIAAIDRSGYLIKEIKNSQNIYTNYKSLKDYKLRLEKDEFIDCKLKFIQNN